MWGAVKLLSSFCERDSAIKEYLILIVSCTSIISITAPEAAIISTPAACPADVRLEADITVAAAGVSPALTKVSECNRDTVDHATKKVSAHLFYSAEVACNA